jgi:hypothetical protein
MRADHQTKTLTVQLRDVAGKTLYSLELQPTFKL